MNLETIWKTISLGLERAARRRIHEELLARDDRSLADMGYSRELLERGVGAWPWRAPPEELVHLRLDGVRHADARPTEAQAARAAAELDRYSDAELRDLALTRGGIAHAVRHGRPGIDDEPERRAA